MLDNYFEKTHLKVLEHLLKDLYIRVDILNFLLIFVKFFLVLIPGQLSL